VSAGQKRISTSHADNRPVEVPDFTRGVWEAAPPLAIVGG